MKQVSFKILLFLTVGLLSALPAQAAVPVEESVGEANETGRAPQRRLENRELRADNRQAEDYAIPPTIEPNTANAATTEPTVVGSTSGEGAQLGQLFYQLQILQQEVQALRGQMEEQDYLIKRLQRDQKEQYLDLDKRVVALYENRPAPGPTTSEPSTPSIVQPSGDLTERDAYTQAFDAMRNREFEASMQGFNKVIEEYPNGQYTPNAYYWIGELHLAANQDAELARQAFMQVVSLYPDHQKAPDAMYKLGIVYHTLGDEDTAQRYLSQVQAEHPNSSAANLAAKYEAELKSGL